MIDILKFYTFNTSQHTVMEIKDKLNHFLYAKSSPYSCAEQIPVPAF